MHFSRVACVLVALVVAACHAQQDTGDDGDDTFLQHDFLFYHRPFQVPVRVRVVLMGLQDKAEETRGRLDYVVDPAWLTNMLLRTLHKRDVHVLQSGRQVQVQYVVSYDVIHREALKLSPNAPTTKLLETVLQRVLPDITPGSATTWALDVQTYGIENIFDALYHELERARHTEGEDGALAQFDHTVFVVYPSVLATKAPYYYTYEGGTPAPLWSARERYVVIDMGATGSQYGSMDSVEGARMPSSFPTVRSAFAAMTAEEKTAYRETRRSPWVDAKLALTVASAVEHLMLPDLLHERPAAASEAQLTLVPVFVLRNHEQPFRPLDKHEGFAYDFDVAHVVKEIQGLQVPGTAFRVVFQRLSLLEAGRQGLHSALKHATEVQVQHVRAAADVVLGGGSRHYDRSVKSYVVNGRVLLDQLQHMVQPLTKALVDEMPGEAAASELRAALFGGLGDLDKQGRKAPVRIFPVFVYSLRGHPTPLLFEDGQAFFAGPGGAAVLSSNHTTMHLPLFGDSPDRPISCNPSDPTRAIVDALLRGLGNVAPPHLRWSTARNRTEADHCWSTGCTTHGFFARARHIPRLALDNVRRSWAIAMIDQLLQAAQRVLQALARFEAKNVHLRPVNVSETDSLAAALNSHSIAVRASAMVKMDLKKKAQRTLLQATRLFDAGELESVFVLLSQLPRMAQQLVDSATDTLAGADAALVCCVWTHHADKQIPWLFLFFLALLFATATGAFIFTSARFKKT